MSLAKTIASTVRDMPEMEAKKLLIDLLLGYERINSNGKTKDDFLMEFDLVYRDIVLDKMFPSNKVEEGEK